MSEIPRERTRRKRAIGMTMIGVGAVGLGLFVLLIVAETREDGFGDGIPATLAVMTAVGTILVELLLAVLRER